MATQGTAFQYERDPEAARFPENFGIPGSWTPDGNTSIIRPVSQWTRRKEKLITKAADLTWHAFQVVNKILGEAPSIQPKWAPAPLLKSRERVKPALGVPRETDSLCPLCVKEVRQGIIDKNMPVATMLEHPGEIKAKIVQRGKEVWMVKECPRHGVFEDVMSNDVDFFKRIESVYPGSDFKSPDTEVRRVGNSNVKYGRGTVLNVDITNRCNMMCTPCFMDANQVGYVHELKMDDIKEILDNSLKIKPRRQLSVQFTGGEPTISPHFLEAIRYAKKVGYFSVQAATNGIRFAQDPEFAKAAYDAGLRIAYLQFDGVTNEANSHRRIKNLFDVKLRAIENLAKAEIDVVLVVTLVNTVNNDQVGPIIRFAIENSDKISFISFQPVSFTGRDEDITDADRLQKRYTSSHLAHDVKKQTGLCEPMRDWYPLSIIGVFATLADHLKGPDSYFGSLSCSCHPNCGLGMMLMVNKKTKEFKPITEFLNFEQVIEDVKKIADAARGPRFTKAQVAASLLRNFIPEKAPKGLTLKDLITKFDKQSGGTISGKDYGVGAARRKDDWLILFVASMWFQDVWNYDFRRTERCIIPYGTQEGEISFCAYNTGVGWRNIVEEMYKNASVSEWYKTHGRHEIYASNQDLKLPTFDHTLKLSHDPKAPLTLPTLQEDSGGGCGCH